MSVPKFICMLLEADGRFRQKRNGVVTSLNDPYIMPQMPDGNQEISIGWERSQTYYGSVRNFSLELGAVIEMASILRNDFYKFNPDRKLYLVIKRYTSEKTGETTYREYYKYFYRGEIDFANSVDNQGEYRFDFTLMEGDLHKQLTAKEGVEYSIPMDADAVNLPMDGMFIKGEFKWFGTADTEGNTGIVGLTQLNNDNPIPGLILFDVMQQPLLGDPDGDTLQYFAEATQDVAGVNFSGLLPNFAAEVNPPVNALRLYAFNVPTNTLRLNIDLYGGAFPTPPGTNLEINQTIDLLAGDRLFLKSTAEFGEWQLMVKAQSKPLATVIRGHRVYNLGRKLIEQITGSADNFQSDLLNGLGVSVPDIIITSGDGVRSIEGAQIKTTWRDYWKAVNAYFMCELQITDKIGIEERRKAFLPEAENTVIELGEIKKFQASRAVDLFATSIKIGHKEQRVDDTNGRLDFNGYQIYEGPMERIASKELDLTSPWKASPWEIEQTRANYDGKTTTDKQEDNDLYAIAAYPDAALNSVESAMSFYADGAPLGFPGQPLINLPLLNPDIQPGMIIQITGTVNNDGFYEVVSKSNLLFSQRIVVDGPLTDELNVNATLAITGGGYYILDRSISVDQLTDPDADQALKDTIYNVWLSPKRMLMRHYSWLAGMFYQYGADNLIFTSGNRNNDLQAGGVIEKANVPIYNLGAPMFLPWFFDFETLVPVNLTEILEITPTPVFAFLQNGRRYTGFLWTAGIAPNTEEEQSFRLLACPDNDLTLLI